MWKKPSHFIFFFSLFFVFLFWWLLPKYLWSYDASEYVYGLEEHVLMGTTGHPVYFYIGWLLRYILPLPIIYFAYLYTFLISIFLLISAYFFSSSVAQLLGITIKKKVTILWIVSVPFYLYYLAQLEVYALSVSFALLSLYFLYTARDKETPIKNIVFSSLCLALGVGTHLNVVFLVPALVLFLLYTWPDKKNTYLFIALGVTLCTGLFIYLPPLFHFENIGEMYRWATGYDPSGHFFGASFAVFVKKIVLCVFLTGSGVLLIPACTRALQKRNKNIYIPLATLFLSMVVLIVLYATSPKNGEIEQLFLAAMVIAALTLPVYFTLSSRMKKIVWCCAILGWTVLIPISFAFSKKDAIVEQAIHLVRAQALEGSVVLSDFLFTQFIVFTPEYRVMSPYMRPDGLYGRERVVVRGLLAEDVHVKISMVHKPIYIITDSTQPERYVEVKKEAVGMVSIPAHPLESIIKLFVELPTTWKKDIILYRVKE